MVRHGIAELDEIIEALLSMRYLPQKDRYRLKEMTIAVSICPVVGKHLSRLCKVTAGWKPVLIAGFESRCAGEYAEE